MAVSERGLKETFASFFEDPSRDSFRELLKGHVGETKNLDFKAEWPKAGVLAKHVLAIANSGGGCIIIGVTEASDKSLEATGLTALQDKADISNSLKTRLPAELATDVSVLDFAYETSDYAALAGKRFQVVFIASDPDHAPFVSDRDGEGLRAGAIYVRREGLSEEASHAEVQRIINARLSSGTSTSAKMELKQHLDHLETLFARVPRKIPSGVTATLLNLSHMWTGASKANPAYPAEDFQQFVLRMISSKKARIERELDL